jgi:hypothetical protein
MDQQPQNGSSLRLPVFWQNTVIWFAIVDDLEKSDLLVNALPKECLTTVLEPEPEFGFAAPRSRSRKKYFRPRNTGFHSSLFKYTGAHLFMAGICSVGPSIR